MAKGRYQGPQYQGPMSADAASQLSVVAEHMERIDEEIRPVIMAINALPFAKTLFSCAGFGKAGVGPRHPREVPPDDQTGHHSTCGRWKGYLLIAYEGDNWKPFHDALSAISDRSQSSRSGFWKWQMPTMPVFGYEFYGRDPSEIQAKWSQVMTLVSSFGA